MSEEVPQHIKDVYEFIGAARVLIDDYLPVKDGIGLKVFTYVINNNGITVNDEVNYLLDNGYVDCKRDVLKSNIFRLFYEMKEEGFLEYSVIFEKNDKGLAAIKKFNFNEKFGNDFVELLKSELEFRLK